MPISLPGPSWATFKYHSPYAAHTLTVPTRQWDAELGDNGHGGFHGWSVGTIDAQDMYDALSTTLLAFWPTNVQIDQIVTYNQVGDLASGVPVDIYAPEDFLGTDGTPGWYKAVQTTLGILDSSFHEMRITMLDSASHNAWDKEPPGSLSAAGVALLAQLTLATNAWSSRYGSQPSTARGITRTLNEALRHAYGMG